jgi:hypothetical protein
MLPHFFLINYLRPMGVEVAGPCGGGTVVVGPRGRGAGWRAHMAEGVWERVGVDTAALPNTYNLNNLDK